MTDYLFTYEQFVTALEKRPADQSPLMFMVGLDPRPPQASKWMLRWLKAGRTEINEKGKLKMNTIVVYVLTSRDGPQYTTVHASRESVLAQLADYLEDTPGRRPHIETALDEADAGFIGDMGDGDYVRRFEMPFENVVIDIEIEA